jgi:hypothetical protein
MLGRAKLYRRLAGAMSNKQRAMQLEDEARQLEAMANAKNQ